MRLVLYIKVYFGFTTIAIIIIGYAVVSKVTENGQAYVKGILLHDIVVAVSGMINL